MQWQFSEKNAAIRGELCADVTCATLREFRLRLYGSISLHCCISQKCWPLLGSRVSLGAQRASQKTSRALRGAGWANYHWYLALAHRAVKLPSVQCVRSRADAAFWLWWLHSCRSCLTSTQHFACDRLRELVRSHGLTRKVHQVVILGKLLLAPVE